MLKKKMIPVGVSGRHAHLSLEALEILFGKNYQLTWFKDLTQKGQFASNEKIDVISSNNQILKNVRILGPLRKFTQVEISNSDNIRNQFGAPIRSSGDIKGSASATLVGPCGKLFIKEGVIIADRHIHLSDEEAKDLGLTDQQIVSIRIDGIKAGILHNVLCRVNKNFSLELHIDADDASAFHLKNGDLVELCAKEA
ncbi:MAG: phosphate propanoyltransferase [Pigeon pea little leaf phytoplasma]|uniref:Phosphate propanoyltransferase n=1 Tax=Candidatus Phytoplasma fabacearum TaxID=2982628 RepID=A0ABU8ZSB7_9MOLU|nr:phosphate propanoyltransferase ['Bituminaria bituminosa' little leaf phytoplasma]MDV3154034.1 phosphate propanoyltransferase [Pigeon pea little leaf phytoplasma]MDO7983546.1 phosphate propanoyltransferase ['Bituminaria bituminosa' little leaf phytoplasma]MDO8023918.1 phosphate propanoyltransferase ['Bituminaria bituminosa' little leaf phytoplasma]MDO8030648.1 phosphate propanoyltransferase ['Bituminaria bituminosa' little leaf phytoplasma]MDV3158036.1 phosphate propanoyltransferase [Pigeon 